MFRAGRTDTRRRRMDGGARCYFQRESLECGDRLLFLRRKKRLGSRQIRHFSGGACCGPSGVLSMAGLIPLDVRRFVSRSIA
jgi:hypothetical protein